jgi:hypothetical protein
MLEEMCEAGAAGTFVLGTHVIPDVYGDNRDVVVLVHDDVESVGERALNERKRCGRHFGILSRART